MRDAILETTERLLETHSLDDLRVADIIKQAGASKTAFYSQYDNKAAVVAALIRRGLEEAAPFASEALAFNTGLSREGLAITIRGWLQTLERHRPLILAAMDGRAKYPELAELYQLAFGRLRERIPALPAHGATLLAAAEVALEGYLRGSRDLTDLDRLCETLSAIYLDLAET